MCSYIKVNSESGKKKYLKRVRWFPHDLKLDRDFSESMHTQFYTGLKKAICAGSVHPGSLLPSVQWFCRTYAISTTTVSRALRELKLEGVITTSRGAGCFVNTLPSPVTEVVVSTSGPIHSAQQAFYYEIITGLKRGFADPARRCVLTHYDESLPAAEELSDLIRLRRADSLVVYRPGPALATSLRGLARTCRIVSLLARPADASIDSVMSDPGPAIQSLLSARVAAGKRVFAFIGRNSLLADPDSPYSKMLQAFRQSLRGARLRPKEVILDDCSPSWLSLKSDEADRLLADNDATLPAGAVVVSLTPHIAYGFHRTDKPLDLIAYTESPGSAAALGGIMTLLYMGLDRAGEAAARLLSDPPRPPSKKPRIVEIAAEIILPGQSLKRDEKAP
jgi:DNA-binding transcriptional regulator YhcF (GntR family)